MVIWKSGPFRCVRQRMGTPEENHRICFLFIAAKPLAAGIIVFLDFFLLIVGSAGWSVVVRSLSTTPNKGK